VSASEFLATYFAARRDDFRFPDGVGVAEYIVLDTRAKEESFERTLNEKGLTLEKALQLPGYDRIFDKEGFLVYRQSPAGGTVSGP
jgi:hypothetical protein